ncbi:MAG: hypothetical protein MUD08_19405 [Cytophagales bacterium]|nr:hypothetical protein [Cytophagales bacterium]
MNVEFRIEKAFWVKIAQNASPLFGICNPMQNTSKYRTAFWAKSPKTPLVGQCAVRDLQSRTRLSVLDFCIIWKILYILQSCQENGIAFQQYNHSAIGPV